MGWGRCGTDEKGREIGHAVEATCDRPGCDEAIDRGLAYVCGNMHGGGAHGCGGYFCESHLYLWRLDDGCVQLCEACSEGKTDDDEDPRENPLMPCMYAGCGEFLLPGEMSTCVGCGGTYCDRHLERTTWYGGDVVNVCFGCRAVDDEPTPW